MKIVTYNMHLGGRGRTHWTEILNRVQPEIFLVQESFDPAEHLPPHWHGNRHAQPVWQPVQSHGKTKVWGSAVLVEPWPIVSLQLPKYSGWVVGVEIPEFTGLDGSSQRLRVFSLHAPTGLGTYQKVVNAILDMVLDHRGGCDVVIGGDFNLTVSERHASEDRVTVKADLNIQARLREEFGVINCWQTANPDTPLVQTLAWVKDKTFPYHCDGLFVPEAWAPRLRACTALTGEVWDKLSDHRPVVAEFDPFESSMVI